MTNAGGTSATSASDQYTYIAGPPPPPDRRQRRSGRRAAPAPVTISGTNFTGATAVDFGTAAATFTVNNDNTITATAPAGTGTVDVTVTNAGRHQRRQRPTTSSPTAPGRRPGPVPSPVAGGWQLNGSAHAQHHGVAAEPAAHAGHELAGGLGLLAHAGARGRHHRPPSTSSSGRASGADGMTFILANASVTKPTALGANGGGEGFAGINGIAVSLDHWQERR